MVAFRSQLDAAHINSGSEGFVTRADFIERFATDAWKGLRS